MSHYTQYKRTVRLIEAQIQTSFRLEDIPQYQTELLLPEDPKDLFRIENQLFSTMSHAMKLLYVLARIDHPRTRKEEFGLWGKCGSDCIQALGDKAFYKIRVKMLCLCIENPHPRVQICKVHLDYAFVLLVFDQIQDDTKALLYHAKKAYTLAQRDGQETIYLDGLCLYSNTLSRKGLLQKEVYLELEPRFVKLYGNNDNESTFRLLEAHGNLHRIFAPEKAIEIFRKGVVYFAKSEGGRWHFYNRIMGTYVECKSQVLLQEGKSWGADIIQLIQTPLPHHWDFLLYWANVLQVLKEEVQAQRYLNILLEHSRDSLFHQISARVHLIECLRNIDPKIDVRTHVRFLQEHEPEAPIELRDNIARVLGEAVQSRTATEQSPYFAILNELNTIRDHLQQQSWSTQFEKVISAGLRMPPERALREVLTQIWQIYHQIHPTIKVRNSTFSSLLHQDWLGWLQENGTEEQVIQARLHLVDWSNTTALEELWNQQSEPVAQAIFAHEMLNISKSEQKRWWDVLNTLLQDISLPTELKFQFEVNLAVGMSRYSQNLGDYTRSIGVLRTLLMENQYPEHEHFVRETLINLEITSIPYHELLDAKGISEMVVPFLKQGVIGFGAWNQKRLQVFHRLLHWGPITTPEALDVAEKLYQSISWNNIPPNSALCSVEEIIDRYNWIRTCVHQKTLVPKERRFPHSKGFDDLPTWLVSTVHNQYRTTTPIEMSPLDFMLILHHRPDCADLVLRTFLQMVGEGSLGEITQIIQQKSLHVQGWSQSIQYLRVHKSKDIGLQGLLSALVMSDPQQTSQDTPEDSFSSMYDKAIQLMLESRENPEIFKIRKARKLLQRCVDHAPEELYVSYLISLGNAWRILPEYDLDKSISFYEEALRLVVYDQQKGQLYKVYADVLILKEDQESLQRAESLLLQSISLRHGRHQFDSHISLVKVYQIQMHKGWKSSDVPLSYLLRVAQKFSKTEYEEDLYKTVLALLHDVYLRDLHFDLDGWLKKFNEVMRNKLQKEFIYLGLSCHPDMRYLQDIKQRLKPTPKELQEEMRELVEFKPPFRNVTEIEAELGECMQRSTKNSILLCCQSLLQAGLFHKGKGTISDIKKSCARAIDNLSSLEFERHKCIILQELAELFQPPDGFADPLCDMDYSYEIIQKICELEGGEGYTTVATKMMQGRAIRYNPKSTPVQLQEVRKTYQNLLDEVLETSERWTLLINLSELVRDIGEGDEASRIDEECRLLHQAEEITLPHQKDLLLGRLGWSYTQKADVAIQRKHHQKAFEFSKKADTYFASIEHPTENDQINWTTCRNIVADLENNPHKKTRLLKEQIKTITNDVHRATLQHNLAQHLLKEFERSGRQANLYEAQELITQALPIRKRNPRFHWEDTFQRTRIMFHLCRVQQTMTAFWALRYSLTECLQRAKELGAGEELFNTAEYGLQLLFMYEDLKMSHEIGIKIWEYIEQSIPSLLHRKDFLTREHQAATSIFHRLLDLCIPSEKNDSIYTISAQETTILQEWLIRLQRPNRRHLEARLYKPLTLSLPDWLQWVSVLEDNDHQSIGQELSRIRDIFPEFLVVTNSIAPLWEWLESQNDAVAVSGIFLEKENRHCIFVHHTHKEQVFWTYHVPKNKDIERVYREIKVRLYQDLPFVPKVILWNPPIALRMLPPQTIWGHTPVASSLVFGFPTKTFVAQRMNSTLLMMADPGNLHGYGEKTIKELLPELQKIGSVQILASKKESYGHALLRDKKNVIHAPASPQEFLVEAKNHKHLIVIAHGEVQGQEAHLICMNKQGQPVGLTHEMLAANPQSIAGACVILISCSSGQVGENAIVPGGIAGTLLAAGAQWVVAPLKPIHLDVGQQRAKEIIRGLQQGLSPWEIAINKANAGTNTPLLGPPRKRNAQMKQEELYQFVTWVG